MPTMRGRNPNEPDQPFTPRFINKAKPMMPGATNPYGFGREQTMGRIAPQRNVPGMPTNTLPLPRVQRGREHLPRLGGY